MMYIYTAEEIHNIDQSAEKQGFSLFALMENAGRNLAQSLQSSIEKQEHILILAGRGNNGGDGIVLARYLKDAGYQVSLYFPMGFPKTETARMHLDFYHQQYVSKENYQEEKHHVIIDALLGSGSTLPLRNNLREVVHWANNQSSRRLAIDVPTGVGTDHGALYTENTEFEVTVFQADATFVLHGAKPSAFLLPASRFYGEVVPIDIGLKQGGHIKQTSQKNVRATLPERDETAHKGTYGTSYLIAGSDDMPGSALLAATGAIRSGTGKLVMGTSRFAAGVIAPRIPEATYMLDGLKRVSERDYLPSKVEAIGIGPGLHDEIAVEKALNSLIPMDIPLVIDAGALLKRSNWKRDAPTVLTPHPGEFANLIDMSVSDIQANRIAIAQDFARRNDVILVLKGQYTVIALPDGYVNINPTGNTGLAKGGSGDVLTGMITSMLSYYENPCDAVRNAVYLHGMCADLWVETNSETTMTASDFHVLLPKVFQRLEQVEKF